MNTLPDMIVIDFCEWLKHRINREDRELELDIFELVLNREYSAHLNRYAEEYLGGGGIFVRAALHDFIDSEEFGRCLRHVHPHFTEEWRFKRRHDRKFRRMLLEEFVHCMHCVEWEEDFDAFLEKYLRNHGLEEMEGPIDPERLVGSTRIFFNRSDERRFALSGGDGRDRFQKKWKTEDHGSVSIGLMMQSIVGLPIEVDFLEWMLKNKNKPVDLQKMPMEVFENLAAEYCKDAGKDANVKRKLIRAFKQTDPAILAKKLLAGTSTFL